MPRRTSMLLPFACFGLLAASACKSETTPPPASPQSETTQTTAGTTQAPAQGGEFTASDTFGVMRAIHMAEVEHGMLAQHKAADPRVRALAEKVVADHKARMQKDDQVMSGLGFSPRTSSVSQQIKGASDQQTSRLDAMSGNAFDLAYLDEQVNYYRGVLDLFDRTLIPGTRDAQIRTSLQTARERANEHLREAQELRAAIATPTR